MTSEEKDERIQQLTKELAIANRSIVNMRLDALEKKNEEHEKRHDDIEARIRALTVSATEFKTLVSLSLGGGLLSAAGLIKLIFFPG